MQLSSTSRIQEPPQSELGKSPTWLYHVFFLLICIFTLNYRGFNDVTSASGTYYQLWSDSSHTINTGSDGLAKFGTLTLDDSV